MFFSHKQKVLVTGGAGFIGSHQVDALVSAGYDVVVVDSLVTGDKRNLNPKAKFYEVDIRDDELGDVFEKEKPEFVFHFAAQINVNHSVEDPVYDADVNIMGALNLLENCVAFKVKKIMFSSTGGALYGEAEVIPTPEEYPTAPISPYGIAKLTVENYIKFYHRQFKLEYGIMRYANVYGPRQNPKGEAGVITIFIEKMLKGEEIVIHGDGHQTRDFVYVGDIVRANLAVFKSDKVNTFNVGWGRQSTINEVFQTIKRELKVETKEKHLDVFSGQKVSCLSAEKIKNAFGFVPEVTLDEGIGKTIEWFKKNNQ